jgi:hypothetical protein
MAVMAFGALRLPRKRRYWAPSRSGFARVEAPDEVPWRRGCITQEMDSSQFGICSLAIWNLFSSQFGICSLAIWNLFSSQFGICPRVPSV